jgi:hypothetical protein
VLGLLVGEFCFALSKAGSRHCIAVVGSVCNTLKNFCRAVLCCAAAAASRLARVTLSRCWVRRRCGRLSHQGSWCHWAGYTHTLRRYGRGDCRGCDCVWWPCLVTACRVLPGWHSTSLLTIAFTAEWLAGHACMGLQTCTNCIRWRLALSQCVRCGVLQHHCPPVARRVLCLCNIGWLQLLHRVFMTQIAAAALTLLSCRPAFSAALTSTLSAAIKPCLRRQWPL